MSLFRFLLAFALLSLGACTNAAPKESPELYRIQRIENGLLPSAVIKGQVEPMKLADRMAFYKVPGVSIAVMNDGKIEWAKGYGVVEAGSAKAVTTETRFQAASISKPVAAVAALLLVEQGKLKLDDDVNTFLKSWKLRENEFTKYEKVTLRRILDHSAALNGEHFDGYATGAAVPTIVQVLEGHPPANSRALAVTATPGDKFRYSGGGYNLMQLMLTDVTGEPFPQLLQSLVLAKLGMTHSTYSQPLPKDMEASAASGHDGSGNLLQGRWHTYPEMATAGLWTTPTDLALFALNLQESWQGKPSNVLSPEMTKLMLTKHVGGYGLGIALGGDDKVTSFSHGGANEGFRAILFGYVDKGQGAVVMTNSDRGDALFNEILRSVAHEYAWPDYQPAEKTIVQVDPAVLQSYAGDYEAGGRPIKVTVEADKLYVDSPELGKEPVRFYPSAPDRFFLLEGTLEISFPGNTKGTISELRLHAGPKTFIAKRLH